MKYFQLIDNLMQLYTSGEYASEAVQAKNEFFELAGIFDEQSGQFDMKMAQFTDWYIFSRKMNQFAVPPIQHFVEKRPARIAEDDVVWYRNLANNRYSLFEFLKLKGNDLVVRDLFSKHDIISFTAHRALAAQSRREVEAHKSPEAIVIGSQA
jgi:hypothetical protein